MVDAKDHRKYRADLRSGYNLDAVVTHIRGCDACKRAIEGDLGKAGTRYVGSTVEEVLANANPVQARR